VKEEMLVLIIVQRLGPGIIEILDELGVFEGGESLDDCLVFFKSEGVRVVIPSGEVIGVRRLWPGRGGNNVRAIDGAINGGCRRI